MAEMLCIPTTAPRPLDSYDKLCRSYVTAKGEAFLYIQAEIEARAQLEGVPFMTALDEAHAHGLIVREHARHVIA